MPLVRFFSAGGAAQDCRCMSSVPCSVLRAGCLVTVTTRDLVLPLLCLPARGTHLDYT